MFFFNENHGDLFNQTSDNTRKKGRNYVIEWVFPPYFGIRGKILFWVNCGIR